MDRVAVVGATGQIGRPLCTELARIGHPVSVFSRDPAGARQRVPGAAAYTAWRPDRLSAECLSELSAADAVIYLAGAPLFDGRRHTRQDVLRESAARAQALGLLVDALGKLGRRSRVLIAASSVGYYGYAESTDTPVDESQPAGTDWWGQASAAIEEPARAAMALGIRSVPLRTGYVLTRRSLAAQVAQFRRHAGGWIGTGRSWVPWIHIADEVGLIVFALHEPKMEGPVNATAPRPARGREFARALGRATGHRAWLPVPTPLVRPGLGVITDILVHGKPVVPAKATALGYPFAFPALDGALHDLLSPEPDHAPQGA